MSSDPYHQYNDHTRLPYSNAPRQRDDQQYAHQQQGSYPTNVYQQSDGVYQPLASAAGYPQAAYQQRSYQNNYPGTTGVCIA